MSARLAVPLRIPGACSPRLGSLLSGLFGGFFLVGGIALDASRAQAADRAAWQHCMQLTNPALATTSCSSIIRNTESETPDNLAYAYLYRARAGAYCLRKDQATSDFRAALQRDPSLVHAWYGLGQLAMDAQDYKGAEEAFDKAVASNGEDADVDRYAADSPGTFRSEPLRARGFARFRKGDPAQALPDYAAAIKACPTCSAAYRNRGILLATQRKMDEAFADFNRAIALNPRALDGFFTRAFVLARMQKFDQAILNFTEALRLNPNAPATHRARADAYEKLGKTKEAEEDRKRADSIDADLREKRRASCGTTAADADDPDDEAANGPATAADATGLDEAALTALVSGKKWQAKQGLWIADLEFRRDGTFRQRSRDETQGNKLQVTADGAWIASQNRLCIFTNVPLCMSGHVANGVVTLKRRDDTLEYTGPEAKFQAINLDNASAPIKEYPLDEKFYAAPQGPAAANGAKGPNKGPKTLLYYIHGLPVSPRLHNPLEQYFVSQIRKSEGWDVIDADFPFKIDTQYMVRGNAASFAVAAHVARRIKELKAKGYQRIFVGGQLMGGWAALALSTQPKLPLDGIIMIAPACCSGRAVYETGAPSADFINNKLYFEQLIKHDLYPTAAVFFDGDEYDPGGRGEAARAALTQNKVASLVIDRPAGFDGEGAVWLPVFDYSYRECMVAFLKAPGTTQWQCAPRTLSSTDFRTIFLASQLPDLQSRTVDPATLIGKEFAGYPAAETYRIASADRTVLKSQEAGERSVPSSFRAGKYCVAERVKFQRPADTDVKCHQIVRWSDRELLVLDAQGRQVTQWWVAKDE